MKLMIKVHVTCDGATSTRAFTEFPVRIGRSESCHLRLRSPRVSRHHARIDLAGNDLLLVDEGSRNGIFCNGVRVNAQDPVRLGDGDRIEIGSVTATVRISEMTELLPPGKSSSLQLPARSVGGAIVACPVAAPRQRPATVTLARLSPAAVAPMSQAGASSTALVDAVERVFVPLERQARASVSFDDVQQLAKPFMPPTSVPTDLNIDALLEGLSAPLLRSTGERATPRDPRPDLPFHQPWVARLLREFLLRLGRWLGIYTPPTLPAASLERTPTPSPRTRT
jgi:pSer/pThr/pTyr-binding forkhead associated (FHA) protein